MNNFMPLHIPFLKFITTLFAIVCMSVLSPAYAQNIQQSDTALAEEFTPLLDKAKELGLNVIIVGPETKEKKFDNKGPSFADQALKVRSELKRIFSNAGHKC